MRTETAVFVLVSLLVASVALADSDGYFCTGRGYLAHQFSGLSVPTPGHILTVTFVGPPHGLSEPVTLELPPFQVHGMKCNHDSVELRAWDTVYVVDLSRRSELSLKSEVPVESSLVLAGFESMNLGDLARPGVVRIPSDDPEHIYRLRIKEREEHAEGVVRHRIETALVQLDAAGDVVQRREIFRGVFEETID